jgi:hypothetical protein
MSTTPVAGMNYPTQKGMISGNPRDSAMQAGINSNNKLASMGKIGGKKRGGASNEQQTIAVPQYQMLYTPQGGNASNPNAQIQQQSQVSTQSAANRVYDSAAMKQGGSRKFKGGQTNLSWGYYSGGKKNHKSKKHRKSRKTRKSRKSRKY